jgi:SAM-dependent methyltransferase
MKALSFLNADPAGAGFQYLEDLATAYWYSEVLFAALRLKLFDYLGGVAKDIDTLTHESGCDQAALARLLRVLCKLELVGESDGKWRNNPAAAEYLVSAGDAYLGEFLLYRRYIKQGWQGLFNRLSASSEDKIETAAQEDYETRNLRYVRVMDALAREKAREIETIIPGDARLSPILDIGGGAGALCRAFSRARPGSTACLLDLPEVIQAAREIYPQAEAWRGIDTIECDFRTFEFSSDQRFGLILMANFLHVYGAGEARKLVEKALLLLEPDGLLVVHDYFPDCGKKTPHKGALYDLNMLLNTYDGACHTAEEITDWLSESGIVNIWRRDLSSDSTLIIAAGPKSNLDWPPTG